MSGHDLIDDYLSELMDDPGKGQPKSAAPPPVDKNPPAAAQASVAPQDAASPPAEAPSPSAGSAASPEADPLAAFREGGTHISDDEFEAMLDALQGPAGAAQASEPTPSADPLAAFREGGAHISDDEFEAMLDALQGSPSETTAPAAPQSGNAGDPLAAFRDGGEHISDDEFDAMLDALHGQGATAPSTPSAAAPAATGDPLAAFRDGGEHISDDEFESMLDALQGGGGAATAPPRPAPSAPPKAEPPLPVQAIQGLLPPAQPAPAHSEAIQAPERRRRAEDRITSWLRFNLARQSFAVEVLKVQEVLRLTPILPVRGTEESTPGVMNLRGQIVPVMDLAIRLGFPATQTTEASRIIVLEEKGETLGLLVASVADVLNLSEGRMERISGTPSLVAAEVVRGISRRDGQIIVMLDASRLLG